MRNSGQQEIAVRIFHDDVANGLDDEFERLIAIAMQEEMLEIEAADSESGALAQRLAWLIGGTSALVLFGTLAAGLFLYRSIVRPISRLGAGAVAIGRGALSYRIGALGSDEFGMLARRFDEMAAQLEEQQRQLLSAQSDLEAQVQARTAELKSANDALRDRDRARVRFLADISHELRTPLTVLRGEAEVTLRSKPSKMASYRETLGRIVEQAQEMGRLVDDLLLLARAETSEIRVEKNVFDLEPVTAEAAREAEILGRARGIKFQPMLDGAALVEGDRHRTKQVLMIVLDNAVKYSVPEGLVTLSLTTGDGAATIAVRNRCDRFDDGDLPRVFERFNRGRDEKIDDSAGSGLGLAIARWMVEKQGGNIELRRADGDFVQLTIRFPLLASPSAATEDACRAKNLAAGA
jgi:signal transduction histidine kinase